MPSIEEWNIWLKNIKIEALKEGITENTIDEELSNIQPQKKIILTIRFPNKIEINKPLGFFTKKFKR